MKQQQLSTDSAKFTLTLNGEIKWVANTYPTQFKDVKWYQSNPDMPSIGDNVELKNVQFMNGAEPTIAGGEGWVIGWPYDNCIEACQRHKLVCTDGGLLNHNGDVDSSEKVHALAEKLGANMPKDRECHSVDWDFSPSIDTGKGWGRCYNKPRLDQMIIRPAYQFSCFSKGHIDPVFPDPHPDMPPEEHTEQRLCYCESPSENCPTEEGWRIAEEFDNCNKACQQCGLVCTEDGLREHNNEVDDSDKVMALIKRLGGSTKADKCKDYWLDKTGNPVFTDWTCQYSAANKPNYNCGSVDTNFNKRLCYCHKDTREHGWMHG